MSLLLAGSLSAQLCASSWVLEQALEIGSAGGPVDFTGILDMAIGWDGKLYITQSFTPMVTVLSPQGRPDRTIGRAGQGPGEFRFTAIDVGLVGDSVWATDVDGLEVFAPNGRPAYSVSFRTVLPEEGSVFNPGVPLPDASLLGGREINDSRAYYGRDRFPVLRFSRTGSILDTIATIDRPHRETYVEIVEGTRVSHPEHPLYRWATPFQDMPFALTVDHSAVLLIANVHVDAIDRTLLNPLARGASGTFEILKISIAGDTLLRRPIRYEPRLVTRADETRLRELFAAVEAGDNSRSSMPNPFASDSPFMRERRRTAAREAITFPTYYPPVRGLVAGSDGTIWILRELRMDESDRWEAYDARGQLLGTLQVPFVQDGPWPWIPRLDVQRVSRDELWGATRDDLGVNVLRKYRVRNGC